MSIEPQVDMRVDQPYVGASAVITMTTFAKIADRIPEIVSWLGARGIAPAGPPFFRYNVIDLERDLRVEAGVPIATAVAAEGDLFAGVLPAGRYATVTHRGHPDQLHGVTAELLRWAEERGLRWDCEPTSDGERWGCRLELFKTDPRVEPDLNKWETELAFRLAA